MIAHLAGGYRTESYLRNLTSTKVRFFRLGISQQDEYIVMSEVLAFQVPFILETYNRRGALLTIVGQRWQVNLQILTFF
jgi:hypothetical protein